MCQSISECELLVGTCFAEGIIGQRPFAPHQQVEHMAAPTSSASPVKMTLASGAPSTHGTFETSWRPPTMSVHRGGPKVIGAPSERRD